MTFYRHVCTFMCISRTISNVFAFVFTYRLTSPLMLFLCFCGLFLADVQSSELNYGEFQARSEHICTLAKPTKNEGWRAYVANFPCLVHHLDHTPRWQGGFPQGHKALVSGQGCVFFKVFEPQPMIWWIWMTMSHPDLFHVSLCLSLPPSRCRPSSPLSPVYLHLCCQFVLFVQAYQHFVSAPRFP